jgi:hypothetical protein
MVENKSEILVGIFIILMIVCGAILYSENEKNVDKIGMFPVHFVDMNISTYKGGYEAIQDIKGLHGGLPRDIENAYVVEYGNNYSKAKFWVTEAPSNNDAVSLVDAMNSVVNNSGVYSNSTTINIDGINVYFVSGSSGHGLFHYFYAKDNKIFWVEIDNPNKEYRMTFLRDAVEEI